MAWPERTQRWTRCVILVGTALGLAGALAGGLMAGPPGVPPVPATAPPAPFPVPPHPTVAPAPVVEKHGEDPYPMPPELVGLDLNKQSQADVDGKSSNCLQCHEQVKDPHYKSTVHIGCTDCHGANEMGLKGCNFPPQQPGQRGCPAAPPTQNPGAWTSSANPVRSYTLLNHESPDYIRFVNPGDLRISHISCGTTNCHPKIVQQDRKSMMAHGCMLWGAALYNNGSIPNKVPRYGEFYSMRGVPLRAQTFPPPTKEEAEHHGVIPYLDPLPRFEMSQPGNILRIFERGGAIRTDIGIPNKKEDPGRPILTKLSIRGLGTQNRTDPVFIGLQKTRLFDPTLNFLGTNDHPGDYRSSGCSACHIIYANDRSPVHSGPYAKYGNLGMATAEFDGEVHPDPMIPKNESGHPIQHRFAKGNSIPTSQCMICHVHPGTTVMNSYIGWMWYDEETDGELLYPTKQKRVTAEQNVQIQMANPDEAALRGKWSDFGFLANLIDLNPLMDKQQLADFHGHGWLFRAVFKHDRKGHLLDYNGKILPEPKAADLKRGIEIVHELQQHYVDDPARNPYCKMSRKERNDAESQERAGVPMHLVDLHVEKGMHCIDCHFVQDMHGNNRLQMEVRAGIEIACVNCHGTATQVADLRTSGPAAYTSSPDGKGRDLTALRTPSGKPRFERRGNKIFQNSMVEKNLSWEVVQTKDTIDPKSEHYNEKSAIAKTVHFEGEKSNKMVWGQVPPTPAKDDSGCAHSDKKMTCQACHSSWNPTCYGCHLPQKANYKMPQLHNEGDVSRNYTAYDWQTLRDDVFMLAKDGDATGNRTNCSRSSCAIHVSSFNNNREDIYTQQQTISGEGFSGIAFSTNVPHTVSGKGTTKQCTDCHCSKDNDNNAIMAQLLMQGTNYMNFMGRYCWVAAKEHGLHAVVVAEQPEPQAVIGSTLHKIAFPEEFEEHEHRGRILEKAYEHPGPDIAERILIPSRKIEVLSAQARGEYLYAACGEGGLKVYDIAFIDDKGFSERFSTAPVSQLGQRFYVKTAYATYACAPATTAPDPTRRHYAENKEGAVAGLYAYIYVCDKYEGIILVGAGTLLDGDPLNNYLKRALTFNPNGLLCGARYITFVGNLGYVVCDAGVVIVDFADPTKPVVKRVIGKEWLCGATSVQVQFRYAYVSDKEGVKVFDITDPINPRPVSKIAVTDVHNMYLARTYAYLAAGKNGLVILDIENPEMPKVDQVFTANGCINDLHDVKLAITYTSEFAYLADGRNGMRIVQLTSPETPGNVGFSVRPTPELIATYKIPNGGEAVAINKALDRDRAVDESGNQLSVFGRLGGRPFNLEETQRMYLRNKEVWKVSDDPRWAGYRKEGDSPK